MSVLGGFSEEALNAYQQAIVEEKELDFSESGTYDFARCVRPDGSAFGTKGKCLPPNKAAASTGASQKAAAASAREGKAVEDGFKKAGQWLKERDKAAGEAKRRRGAEQRETIKAVARTVEKGIRAVDGAARKRMGLPPANFNEDED